MADLKTSVIVDLAGNLQSRARNYGRSLQQFSSRGKKHLAGLNRAARTAAKGIDRLGNRYTAIATGAGAAGTVRMLIGLEQRMERLGIQAGISSDQVSQLKREIFETAQAPSIRVDPSAMTEAVEEIVEKTGDLDFARENLENLGFAISATGAQGKFIGGITAEFQKMGIVTRKDVREALDILTVQGKAGAFTLQNLAALGPRVVTAYTAMGRTGVPAIREMGAALQVVRQGTGSAEQAATAFEALLRTLGDADKVKALRAGGIKVFDAESLQAGKEILRPINEIMVDIIKRTGGKKTLLSQVFDAEAVRAFNAAASEFQRTGNVELLDRFMRVHADGSVLVKDSARAADTASGALQNLFTVWKKFADAELTGPIQSLADTLNSMDPDRIMQIMKGLAYGGASLAALSIGAKGFRAGRALLGKGGKGGVAGALGSAVGAGGTPVFVTNMPGGGFGGDVVGGGKGKGARHKAPKVKVPGRFAITQAASKAGGVRGVAALGAGAVGVASGAVLASGAVGAAAGTVIAKSIEDSSFYSRLGGAIATAMASVGISGAREALNAEERGLMSGVLDIKLTTDPGTKATVRRTESNNLDLDIDAGAMMVDGA